LKDQKRCPEPFICNIAVLLGFWAYLFFYFGVKGVMGLAFSGGCGRKPIYSSEKQSNNRAEQY